MSHAEHNTVDVAVTIGAQSATWTHGRVLAAVRSATLKALAPATHSAFVPKGGGLDASW